MGNEAIATEFFARWGRSFEEMCASFEDSFAPQCRWDQRPLALTVGTDAAINFLRRSRRLLGLDTIEVEVRKIAAIGKSVLCERVDHLRCRNGGLIASAAVVGVLEFDDGRIVDWREYYDAVDLLRQAAVNGFKGLLRGQRS